MPPASESDNWPSGTIFTLGHSTLPIGQFITLLQSYGILQLADIRTVPGSRHNPQYAASALADSLGAAGIAYVHLAELGGLRRAQKNSPNTGWRNASFRGYADYMQTEAFADAVEHLIAMGRAARTAIMCAEAVPWRCHRSLVADALEARGVEAVEIMPDGSWRMHKLTPFAKLAGTTLTYPPELDETPSGDGQ
ncbi:MAG: DUF488 domain-containing protein [Rhodobacterales bacterium]|nr:DUF488 domain-containing protein [Rhodobacterales bacterium]